MRRLCCKGSLVTISAATIIVQGILDSRSLISGPISLGAIALDVAPCFVSEKVTLEM